MSFMVNLLILTLCYISGILQGHLVLLLPYLTNFREFVLSISRLLIRLFVRIIISSMCILIFRHFVQFLLLNRSNMFFKHSKKGPRKCDSFASGIVKKFPESPVNPLYKPRTLAELKALFDHTGINPAPVKLRDGIPEVEGLDAMNLPPVPIGGDGFETIRVGQSLEHDLRDKVDSYRETQRSDDVTDPNDSDA